ncbi:hypothetical protein [Lichenicola sp.]|uniref:hypothetical protein n=1 Tax=Lichenicola sp. TaxID=2804529 RepID=UPI003AFFD13D
MIRRLPLLLPLMLPLALAIPANAAHHRPSHGPGAAPVILTQQTGSALDRAARLLNDQDIAGAVKRGEQPVVLIGSAPLSTHHGDTALFVQVQSASLCGSAGCSTSVYLKQGAEWVKVLDSVSGPIKVLPTSRGGMHDLVVGDKDRWVWAGTGYQDTLPAEPIGNLKRSVERHQERARAHAAAAAAAPGGQ